MSREAVTIDNETGQGQPGGAAPGGATDNLDKLLEEEQSRISGADAELAEEIGQEESKANRERLERLEREKAASAGAAMAIGFLNAVMQMADKDLALVEEETDDLQGALAPVLLKGNAEPPAWVAEYREELNLLMVGIGVGIGVAARYRQAKARRDPVTVDNDAQGDAGAAA